MLAELLGTAPVIRTQYATRWNPDCPVYQDVQCTCGTWYRLTHNAHCHYCVIDLATVEQPAVRPVVTEPVAPVAASSQEVAQAVDAMIEQVDSELEVLSLDYAPDPNKPLTAADVCMMSQEQLAAWHLSHPIAKPVENVTEAEPGPVIEPIALRPVSPDKKQYFVVWAPSMSNDTKRYGLLCRRADGYAIDCSCGDRVHRGRKNGVACKHQKAHNAMLKPATKKTEKAA